MSRKYTPMHRTVRLAFLMEIRLQCQFALIANDQLGRAQGIEDTWYALQGLLIATANISKLAFGGKRPLERVDLRKATGITPTSPLYDRDLRNQFEHFDKYFDEYHAAHPTWGFAGRNIGAGARFTGEGSFSWYGPETGELTVQEHSVSVPVLVAEVRRILPAVETAMWAAMLERSKP